jgi:pimeloyl-ACP methyl ester carboxylesterase
MTRSLLLAFVLGLALPLAARAQASTAKQKGDKQEPMWKHEYAEINGLKLHYVAIGKGKTILFLHGFPEFWYEWRKQLVEFGQDYQAIAPDLRGYNLSAKPEKVEDYAVPLLVADVKALLDRFSPGRKAILVGHDWGGAVAWAFAITHPEYLEKLVIINAPHPAIFARELKNNPEQQKASAYMLLFRSEQAEEVLSANDYAVLESAVLKGTSRPGVFTAEDRKAYLEAWSQPGALTGGLNYYRAARVGPPPGADGHASHEEPAPFVQSASLTVKVPTLVIWGEKDTALLTGNLTGLEQFVPDLQIKRIPQGSHWVIHEEPELVNRYLREFISGKGK